MSDALTSKPPVYGVLSTWLIHDANGKDYKLYQSGPVIHAPLDLAQFVGQVASFVREVEENYDVRDREDVLGNGSITLGSVFPQKRLQYVLSSSVRYGELLGPISREIWFRIPEMNISLENFVNRRRPQPPKVAYVWEVWSVERGDVPRHQIHPGCEISFVANDKNGVPDPNFTFERATPAKLIEALEARDQVKKLFKL